MDRHAFPQPEPAHPEGTPPPGCRATEIQDLVRHFVTKIRQPGQGTGLGRLKAHVDGAVTTVVERAPTHVGWHAVAQDRLELGAAGRDHDPQGICREA